MSHGHKRQQTLNGRPDPRVTPRSDPRRANPIGTSCHSPQHPNAPAASEQTIKGIRQCGRIITGYHQTPHPCSTHPSSPGDASVTTTADPAAIASRGNWAGPQNGRATQTDRPAKKLLRTRTKTKELNLLQQTGLLHLPLQLLPLRAVPHWLRVQYRAGPAI